MWCMATSKRDEAGWNLIFAALVSTSALVSSAWAADTAELSRQVQALQQSSSSLDARLGKLESAIQKIQNCWAC